MEGAQGSAQTRGAITDAAGEAVLQLPVGEHLLRVRKPALAAAEAHLSLRAGAVITVLVELAEEASGTQGTVDTSTRTERRIEDEPLRVEVVSREGASTHAR